MSSELDRLTATRILEARLFASAEPLTAQELGASLGESVYGAPDKVTELIEELQTLYSERGVNVVRVQDAFAIRTSNDVAEYMTIHREVERKLSRPALETLAIIAYHQPITRAEIEEIRGVSLSKGTLDLLLENDWITPKGRKKTPGQPLLWGTTRHFLDHFGLEDLGALPGVEELKAAGLLNSRSTLTSAGLGADSETDSSENPLDDVDVQGALEFADRSDDPDGDRAG